MITIADKLVALGFDPLVDFECRNERGGRGVYIDKWLSGQPQPTQAQLDAVTDQQAADAVEDEKIRRSFELSKKDKVLIKWIASRTGGGTGAEIKAELKAIWEAT